MNFRNISAWCIRNPVPPIVLFIALLLAGVVSFSRLDVNDNPDIEFPGAMVVIAQPGAAPPELEKQVTQIVEASLRSINGVEEINSSVREGSSSTFVQFALGTDIDRGVNDIRDALTKVRSDLPDGILEPQVEREDTTGNPIAYISAEAVDMTLEQLSWYVDDVVIKRLQGIPGMAVVSRGGGVSREIRVILDPARLQSLGITAAQVNAQLRQVNVNAAGGRTEIAGSEQSLRVLGNARNAYQLGGLFVISMSTAHRLLNHFIHNSRFGKRLSSKFERIRRDLRIVRHTIALSFAPKDRRATFCRNDRISGMFHHK